MGSESREEDTGRPLDEFIGPGLQLMEQTLDLDGRELKLIVPRSSDAVMDFYIDAGTLAPAEAGLPTLLQAHHHGKRHISLSGPHVACIRSLRSDLKHRVLHHE